MREIRALLNKILESPLCHNDGIIENENDAEFYRGQAHMKCHIMNLISDYENPPSTKPKR